MSVEESAASLLMVHVKFKHSTLDVQVPAGGKVEDLMDQLTKLTNVHARGQKLIFKGKVLDKKVSLPSAGITSGAKLLLLASEGISQGGSAPQVPAARATPRAQVSRPVRPAAAASSSGGGISARAEGWKKTGAISLRGEGLQAVPAAVWGVGASARLLDLSSNTLSELPPEVKALPNLQRVRLSHNALTDSGVAWGSLVAFQQLTVLALDHNRLTVLPPAIGSLKGLQRLTVSQNSLESVPEELGELDRLERLDLGNNRLRSLPASLGKCAALMELSIVANFVAALPPSLGELQKLQMLLADNNAIPDIPPQIFRGCSSLATLSLHGNPITVETLRETDGWPLFEERRRAKSTKQLGLGVMIPSRGFDEGTDAEEWQHW